MALSTKSNNRLRDLLRKLYSPFYHRQTYRNLAYLLLSIPLGFAYFSFLSAGISAGMGLSFVLIGIPILFLVLAGAVAFAQFERFFAKRLLDVDISAENTPLFDSHTIRDRIVGTIVDLQTWKSLAYLFVKFPLSVMTFGAMMGLAGTAMGMVFAPLLYAVSGGDFTAQLGPVDFNTFGRSLFATLIGIVMLPLIMHMMNGWATLNGRFAAFMLGRNQPTGNRNISNKMHVIESGEEYIDPLEQINTLKEDEKITW